MERFQTAVAAHPEVPRPRISLLQHTFVTDGPGETATLVDELSRYYGLFGAWFANKRPVEQGIMAPLTDEERSAAPHFGPDKIAQNLVVGEPEAVIARLKGYERMGYDQFAIWIDSGISHARKRKSLDLFVRRVMPAFA